MNDDRVRLDTELVRRGLAPSRERAQRLIDAGLVKVNGQPARKPAEKIAAGAALQVLGADMPYVSRGGLKLEKALDAFGVDPAGRVCLDIGASTGGFTDVLLRRGARRVYAVDVGVGQLDPGIAADDRVVSMERVNARAMTADMFPETPALAVMDVSFISIRLILPATLSILGDRGRMLTLVKPQFEAGRQDVGKRGIVSSPKAHVRVLEELVFFVPALGWRVRALGFSPITGGDGNIEFLADIVPQACCDRETDSAKIRRCVEAAHAAHRKV